MADGSSKVTTRNNAKSKSESVEPVTLQSLDLKLNSIIGILERNSSDISDIKSEQKEMCTSIELCHSNISDLKQLLTSQESKILKCEEDIVRITEEKCQTDRKIKKMEEEIRDLEQYSHRNNLIIYGIPEDKGENILHVMRRMAAALQFADWSPSLVDAVHRMGRSAGNKPRPIIIRFISRLDKDSFLNKRKVHRNLKASDLGFSSENHVFVNESLTPANRELLKRTRETARARGFSQVWTANCSIFVRREKGSPAIKIASFNDLDRM